MKLPQLHLRDLFWLVLVCGLAVRWSLERSQRMNPFDLVPVPGHVSGPLWRFVDDRVNCEPGKNLAGKEHNQRNEDGEN